MFAYVTEIKSGKVLRENATRVVKRLENKGGGTMTYQWVDLDRSAISNRYDQIAGLIPFFEWLLFLPRGFRKTAVDRLALAPGDRILELGCGTGRNFPYLADVVGSSGRIYGVDLSAGMLREATTLSEKHGWKNTSLVQVDAADFQAPEPLDGVLFGLSYNTMPHHKQVLARAWQQLRSGGRLVIMDAKVPPGRMGRFFLPFSLWLMKRTLLGNPFIRPWEQLKQVANNVEMEEFLFGSYYVCYAVKP